jgi:acetyltransferase EpsM
MPESILILGAGGHGRVIADIAMRQGIKCLGFLDDRVAGDVNCVPCLGPLDSLGELLPRLPRRLAIVLGIGDNRLRQDLSLRIEPLLAQQGLFFARVIDSSAVISPRATIGPGTVAMPKVVVNANATIGRHAVLNTGSTVDHDCYVGDFAHLSPGVHLAGSVRVGDGTHLGVGAVAIPGISIGAWSVVGAGSVVVKGLPDGVVAYGVPARMKSDVLDK